MKKIKVFATIVGSALTAGCIFFVFLILTLLDKSTPAITAQEKFNNQFTNQNYWVDSDFQISFYGALLCIAVVLIIGFSYWFTAGKDKDFEKDIEDLWNYKFVRFFGICLTITAMMSAFFFFGEIIFSTPEYPPKWKEFPALIYGSAIISVMGYCVFLLFAWIFGKFFGKKNASGTNVVENM
jgi:hypothetical protein